MNNLILCEGFDDIFILGYYLFKTEKWVYDPSGAFSELYTLPKVKKRNQAIEVYKRGCDTLAIWCVGGKDCFDKPFDFLKKTNARHHGKGIQQLFIMTDRDDSEIEDCVLKIQGKMNAKDMNVGELKNNQLNTFNYEQEGESYSLNIIPIIIPFDEVGALETILMEAIEETGEEEKLIVKEAKHYVDEFCQNGQLSKYLQHSRQILKAKFSSCISITNPDRSTALFDTLLMSYPWEQKEVIKRHFGILNELI